MAEFIGYNSNRKLGRMSKETERRFNSAQDRLMLGQQYRQKTRESAWRESYDVYMGDQWNVNPDDPTADIVNVNISFSTINTLVPFVADEDPHFLVSPLSGDADADNAQILEAFMNRLWQSPDVRGQEGLSDAVFDWLLYGDGYVEVGYNVRMLLVFDAQGNPVDNRVRVAEFHVMRVNPWDVWIDPFSDGIHNARWIARRIVLPIEELLADERYRVKSRDDIVGGAVDSDHQSSEDRDRLNDVDIENWVTIYEFYDTVDKYMMSFIWGQDAPIRYIEQVQCPILQIMNYRIPNAPYHIGELEQILTLQHELNKTRSQMITHRRRNIGKWAIAEDRLTDEAIAAMQSGRVNDVIPISGPDMPLEHLINYIAPQPMSADAYRMDDIIRMDINELTGVNEYLRGVPQDISRTATEASIIEGATNTRTRHKLLQVERAARDIGQTLLDVIKDVLPLTDFNELSMYITGREAERVNRAAGEENIHQNAVLTPTPEIFEGRYTVEVERGSTELRNPQVKAQKLQQMVTLMLNATPILMEQQIPFNIKRLLELWFEAEGIEDVEALFEIDEDQALMQQMALMERAMAAAGQAQSAAGAQTPGQGAGNTPPGEPRSQTAQAPSDMINSSNSGMLPSR